MWNDGNYMGGNPIPSGNIKAEVYWEDVHGLIKSGENYALEIVGSGEHAKIKVPVNKTKKGNAMIVYKVNDEIYCSWHVWVTDDPSNGTHHKSYSLLKRELKDGTLEEIPEEDWGWMDRNLGAVSGAITEAGWTRNNGLLYQWGRKDPIPPLVSKGNDFYEVSGSAGRFRHRQAINKENAENFDVKRLFIPLSNANVESNIRLSVKNPLSLIYVNNDYNDQQAYYLDRAHLPVNWFGNANLPTNRLTELNLWSDNSQGIIRRSGAQNEANWHSSARPYRTKSSYDPCPNGWRIPSMIVANIGNDNTYLQTIKLEYSPFGLKSTETYDNFISAGQHVIKPRSIGVNMTKGANVYPEVGMDLTDVNGQDIGLFPGTGFISRRYHSGQYSDIHETYLWTATMVRWADTSPAITARSLRIIPDKMQPDIPLAQLPNIKGRYHFYPLNETTTNDALGCRCIKDPLYELNEYDFPTEYFQEESQYPNFIEGLYNPNTYQVVKSTTETTIAIPVNKAFAVQSQYLNNKEILNNRNFSNLKANILWTNNKSLIQEISLSRSNAGSLAGLNNTFINVKVSPRQSGNAVVTLHNGSIANPVYWSWHIWVTDSDVEAIRYVTTNPNRSALNYINYSPNAQVLDTEFMDRNLGAIEAFPTIGNINNLTSDELTKINSSGGLQYQWGRKDPIPSFKNPDGSDYEIYLGSVSTDGKITYTTLNGSTYNQLSGQYIQEYNQFSNVNAIDKTDAKISKTISYSVENPLVYLIPSNFSPYNSSEPNYTNGTDWLIDEVNLGVDRWGRGDVKSPFDPCPEGWRIPDLTNVDISLVNDNGLSPWYKLGSNAATLFNITNTFKGTVVKNRTTILGYNFKDTSYKIGNYPFMGARGFRGVKENETASYGIHNSITGFWLSGMFSNYTGRPIAMIMDRSKNAMTSFFDNLDPYFAMNCRCVKIKYTTNDKQEGAYPRDFIKPYSVSATLTEDVMATFGDKTSEEVEKETFVLYPNPVKDYVKINGDSNKVYPYQVYNLSNKLILEGKFVNNQTNFSQLAPGIYLLKINESELIKLIKN